MLILKRQAGQKAYLFTQTGGVIEVYWSRDAEGKARLCIDAPPDVVIVREEVLTPEQKRMVEGVKS